ncbi:MAG TPA: tetratricopeptide repeat protein [Vicinamibacterales bacterium]
MLLTVVLVLVPMAALAQDAGQFQRMFEAGKYQQVVESASSDAPPPVLYTAAQSHQKLGATDQALETYRRLANLPESDPWHFVGLAAQQLLEGQTDAALNSARRAVEMDGNLAAAHYQLGLVLARRQDWRDGAEAFDRAAELDPANAYAHYYGGLMHYRANRPDRMAIHFEQFLKLAPESPERPEVMSIMKTIRGR